MGAISVDMWALGVPFILGLKEHFNFLFVMFQAHVELYWEYRYEIKGLLEFSTSYTQLIKQNERQGADKNGAHIYHTFLLITHK